MLYFLQQNALVENLFKNKQIEKMDANKIIVFQEKNIRRIWHNEEWYFSVVDVIGILTDSANPSRYWADLKRRAEKEANTEVFAFCEPLKMQTAGGKQNVICANTEGLFRIVMSIPSPKAEPFKLWLARVGKERIDEIENPELAAERARGYYKAMGYDDAWIEMRLKTIDVRGQLTDEWKGRGVKEGQEYAILTAEISKATFGMTPSEYKELKDLKKENLRDHMSNLELIFTMLGEETTRTNVVEIDAQGFDENRKAAIDGGAAAGEALSAYEQKAGKKVVSDGNFKNQIAEAKKKLPKDLME
jgi:DNA-damage-inducible protein D